MTWPIVVLILGALAIVAVLIGWYFYLAAEAGKLPLPRDGQ
jgi:hypothetical protein